MRGCQRSTSGGRISEPSKIRKSSRSVNTEPAQTDPKDEERKRETRVKNAGRKWEGRNRRNLLIAEGAQRIVTEAAKVAEEI